MGYIDELENPKVVGRNSHYDIQNIVLNNNETRWVQCILWNTDVIKKWEKLLIIGEVRFK